MKKIMFNDAYELTDATIEGRKTNTRRAEFSEEVQQLLTEADEVYMDADDVVAVFDTACENVRLSTRYKVGEVVAVAQSYERIYEELWEIDKYEASHYAAISEKPGWRNKMFVKAELMPHRIRITGIHAERLQDISDEDCIKEGVLCERFVPARGLPFYTFRISKNETSMLFASPRSAFAALIEGVSGRGTWSSNPWVVVYEYELIK